MPTCVICLDVLKNPAALPCGRWKQHHLRGDLLILFRTRFLLRMCRTAGSQCSPLCAPTLLSHMSETLHIESVSSTIYQIYIADPTSIAAVDPNLVPHNLQLHVSPSIRKLSLDYSVPKTVKTEEPVELECARLRAENQSLKNCCGVWCNRARLHARTTLGLIGMVRMAKDAAMSVKAEKEQLEKEIQCLKRKLEERE